MKKSFLAALMALAFTAGAQNLGNNLGIVPAPVSVKSAKGHITINSETSIIADSMTHPAVKFLNDFLKKNGFSNVIVNASTMGKKPTDVKNAIVLQTKTSLNLPSEGYELKISESQVLISGHGAGLFYGLMTFLQMVNLEKKGVATVQCATINDAPRFGYRGLHLDVSRHFFPPDFIKKYLDLMAIYKLNYFHWHLTDDQGWRLEIKKYPNFTKNGATRAQTKVGNFSGNNTDLFDNTEYSGFYTQEEVKDIVAYAAERYINVVPEIEMPGHSMAGVTAYPVMSCDPNKKYKVGETWGVYTDVYCPSDTTFHILGDVMDEVMDMFPCKYVHIGGDECPKDAWKQSAFCQQLIKDSLLRDEAGLQSYFIRRMERHLNKTGHKIIGWDEILEGGLAPNATVMSWRGEEGGIAAAQLNHDVIMTPGSGGLYLDHAQSKSEEEPLSIGGFAPLSKTYSYNPVPATLTADQQKHIIGVQGNVWTEYMATPEKVEYMVAPRILALSEVAWTPQSGKDYNDFSANRVPHQLRILETKGYNYRVPEPMGIADTTLRGESFTFDIQPSVEGAAVHYTIDGFTPRETDMAVKNKLKVTVPKGKQIELKTIVTTPGGKRSNVVKTVLDNK